MKPGNDLAVAGFRLWGTIDGAGPTPMSKRPTTVHIFARRERRIGESPHPTASAGCFG